MTFQTLLATAGLMLVGTVQAASHDVVYDAAAEFTSTASNPNGVWSYGYDEWDSSGAYAMKPFASSYADASYLEWHDAGHYSLGTPSFFKRLAAGTLNGLSQGQIALHPGPRTGHANDDAAILRFTAPSAAIYTVDSQFFAGHWGETTAWIVQNGNFGSPLHSDLTTSDNPSFHDVLVLGKGDTLDFVVGNAGDYGADTTPLSVTISAVPEPETAALLLAGLAMFGATTRRRG